MMKIATLVLMAMFGFGAASAAHAQILDVGIDAGAGATSSTSRAGTDVDASVDAALTGDAGTTTEGSLAGGLQAGFSVDRKDLEKGTEYSATQAKDVLSAASLEAYAASIVKGDARVDEIAVENGELTIRYKAEAKLLGLIPGSIMIRTDVSPEGEVKVSYPWYAFLMTKAESRAELEERLNHDLDVIIDDLAEDIGIAYGNEVRTVPMNDARRMALIIERLRYSLYAQGSAEART